MLSLYNPTAYCSCCDDPRKLRHIAADEDEQPRALTMRELLALEGADEEDELEMELIHPLERAGARHR